MAAVRVFEGPFTVAEYYRLGELGILGEDDRVELINGQIVQMTPISPAHAGCVAALTDLLSGAVGKLALVWVQNPFRVGDRAEPQPDLCVVRRRADSYRKAHPRPGDALLVIEVADTSLEYDRDVKIPLYARAGVPETWLVDLQGDRIEVHCEPGLEGYADVRVALRGESVRPRMLEGVELSVQAILG